MRAIPLSQAEKLNAVTVGAAPVTSSTPKDKPEDSSDRLVRAVESLPVQMTELLKNLPVPVIAPRPPGMWIIDVERGEAGEMARMKAQFHET